MQINPKSNKEKSGLPRVNILYLTIVFVIGCLGLINVVNIGWLNGFGRELREREIGHELTQARRAADMMQKSIDRQMENILTLSSGLATVGVGSAEADIFIGRFLKENNHAREIFTLNTEGGEIGRYSRGRSYFGVKPADHAHLERFEKAKAGEIYFSHVNYSEFAEPYIIMAVPVRKFDFEAPEAVLMAHYYLRGMWEIAIEIQIGKTGRVSVADDKGMLIADPRPTRVLGKVNLLSLPPVKPILSGREFEGALYDNEDGTEVVGVGVPVKIHGMNWGVVVEQDAAEIGEASAEITGRLAIFLFGNVIIIAVLFWLGTILRGADSELIRRREKIIKEKEAAEREKNKTLLIISNFPGPILVFDGGWRLALFNPAAARALGLAPADIGGKTDGGGRVACEDLRGLLKGLKYEAKILTTGENGLPAEEEVTIRKSAGDVRRASPFYSGTGDGGAEDAVYRVATAPICDDKTGECFGYMKIFFDLTREKEIDRLKSEFISIAAHQLRTPLSAIKWVLKMALDGDAGRLNAEQAKLLTRGYISNERIINLVNDMLDVSRIEEGRFGYDFRDCDPGAVLAAALDAVSVKIGQKKIKLTVKRPKKVPRVRADKQKLVLALQNLLDNAAEYSPENGRIEAVIESDKKSVKIIIKDNGVGIPRKDQDKLFSKFFRADNVVRMQTDGSGLGLFIVKNIIDKHGGKITFVSKEGVGTEFTVILPLAPENTSGK